MIYALAALIVILQFADYWLTIKVLKRGGTELNPFMRFLFEGFGANTALIIGKFYVILFVSIGAYLDWFDSDMGLVALLNLAGLYSWVIWHNLRQYRKR